MINRLEVKRLTGTLQQRFWAGREPPEVLMADEHDVAFEVQELRSPDPRARANMLRNLLREPTLDRRVLEACEQLLDDKTITLLSIPFRFGEIRYVAAQAVLLLRHRMGNAEPVVVTGAVPPLSGNDIGRLATEAGIEDPGSGVEKYIALMEKLVAAGKAPAHDVYFNPRGGD